MGVIKCNRNGCEHIMCRRYSSKFGHICDECLGELIDYLLSVNYDVRDESVYILTERFLEHPKEFKFPDRNMKIKLAEEVADKMFPVGR